MKPAPFKYFAPSSIDAVLDMLDEHADDAKLLAGGQSLVPAMNFRLVQPSILIDINKLDELDYVRKSENNSIKIGAMTRQRTLERDPLVREYLPLVHEALPLIAHPQIRYRGTIGGSLAHADPAAELPAILVALRGRIRLRNKRRERWIAHDECYTGIFTTEVEPDEMMIEIELPCLEKGEGWSFLEFARRKGDYALMGVAVQFKLDEQGSCRDARLVYLNSGDVPTSALKAAWMLEGEKPTEELFEESARVAAYEEIKPIANIHATVPYLQHLAQVLTRRALNTAWIRASESIQH